MEEQSKDSGTIGYPVRAITQMDRLPLEIYSNPQRVIDGEWITYDRPCAAWKAIDGAQYRVSKSNIIDDRDPKDWLVEFFDSNSNTAEDLIVSNVTTLPASADGVIAIHLFISPTEQRPFPLVLEFGVNQEYHPTQPLVELRGLNERRFDRPISGVEYGGTTSQQTIQIDLGRKVLQLAA